MTNQEGNLDSPSISVIYYHTRFISVASVNRVCSRTHPIQKEKENPHPLPTSSPPTRRALLRNSAPHQLLSRRPPLSSTAVIGGRRLRSKRHGILPLPLAAAYLHRLSGLWSIGVFCGTGTGIFLMEKVINLVKYSLISYHNSSVAVNQSAEITVDSFFL
jgi:hypothetical protein